MPAKKKAKKQTFHGSLVLNKWLLGFFAGETFASLQDRLSAPEHEGVVNKEGQTGFFEELNRWLINQDRISESELRRYDLNILRHWERITERRNKLEGTPMHMKYFQYLSLLFSEIYLDWYFNRKEDLLVGLNQKLAEWNRTVPARERMQPYANEDLNKIAFWNATGSGKTLLLHVNLLQYQEYFEEATRGRERIDKIILLTPNEGLSNQHLEELELSGLNGLLFDKEFTAMPGYVEIIDVNKLGDKMGDKVVAVEAFEGNNLVLVDEGHRGTGKEAGVWLERREKLCAEGFSFEYSATFGQSVAKGKTAAQALGKKDPSPENKLKAKRNGVKEAYAKCILFDYSYKFFYEDGYGKESLILNLGSNKDDAVGNNYLTACLLSFYQQQWLYRTRGDVIKAFNIENPLWVFVGNKVNDDGSDIYRMLCFFAWFVNHPKEATEYIDELKSDRSRLLNEKGMSIFEKRFLPLSNVDADTIYEDILHTTFNADNRQRLKLTHLKGSSGELSLSLGSSEAFGVINVGDGAKLRKTVEKELEKSEAFDLEDDAFGGSIFADINRPGSKINVLIGSRKFTEGWSSWRVSTMGLLNLGRGEGSQIIQLFGRGVRLKGKDYSLKRTTPHERPKKSFVEHLETLNIFGVRADYMAQFKDYLKEEGVTPSDEVIEIDFETQRNDGNGHLKTLKLKDGYKDSQLNGFKRKQSPYLFEIPEPLRKKIKEPKAVLDLYPKIQALQTAEQADGEDTAAKKNEITLGIEQLSFVNYDRVFLALQEYKSERTWFNLRLDKERLVRFCEPGPGKSNWYTLYAPEEELRLRRFGDALKWERVLIQLLKEYTNQFYTAMKNVYEEQFYEYVSLKSDDDNFIRSYHFSIEQGDEGEIYAERIAELKTLVESGKMGEASKWNANHMVAICFDRHLFYPLIHLDASKRLPVKMRPLGLENDDEVRFVKDLESFYGSERGKEIFKDKDLYLLRNASSKSKGIGFARAGNFYPDFLLWIVDGDKQWLSFIDPKGIRNLSFEQGKLQLYKEIKTYERDLGDPNVVLNAFILSGTKFEDLINNPFESVQELEDRHIFFLEEGGKRYLPKIFDQILKEALLEGVE